MRATAITRGRKVDPSTVAAGTKWTCPMHPEVVRDGPGSCPKCGMALEPMTVCGAKKGRIPNISICGGGSSSRSSLRVPVFVLAMGRDLSGSTQCLPARTAAWIEGVLATPVVLWCGWPFFVRGRSVPG